MSDEDVCKLLKILATGKSAIGIAVCVETSGCLYKEEEEYEVSSA
jgi:pyruvate-formate lyase-activating enzyme